MSKTWLITGASKGLGQAFTDAALRRGDSVAATARDTAALAGLAEEYGDAVLPVRLDVTDRGQARDAVRQTHERFGCLDVVVNNAGYGHFGTVEELAPNDLRDQLETNLFGALNVTQATLPILRAQGTGHIVQVSSLGGVGAFQNLGAYNASKWALEALSEALALEVEQLGIHVTIVEPGGYSTDWAGPSSTRSKAMDAYDFVREQAAARRSAAAPGDPAAAARALLTIVDSDQPPLRILFGASTPATVEAIYRNRLQTWKDWEIVTRQA